MRAPKRCRGQQGRSICARCLWAGGLSLFWPLLALTQNSTGGISGKLTDLYARPLGQATLVLRNSATGLAARTTTGKNGAYKVVGLLPGEYILEAETPQNQHGRLEGILIVPGHEQKVLVAVELRSGHSPAITVAAVPAPAASIARVAVPSPVEPKRAALLTSASLATPASERAQPVLRAASLDGATIADRVPWVDPLRPSAAASLAGLLVGSRKLELQPVSIALTDAAIAALPLAAVKVPAVEMYATGAASAHPLLTEDTPSTTALSSEELEALPLTARNWTEFGSADAANQEIASGMETQDAESDRTRFVARTSGSVLESREGSAFASQVNAVNGMSAESQEPHDQTDLRRIDRFHGQAFLFSRQNLWGARNPFTYWIKQTAAATATSTPVFSPEPYTAPDQQHTWGLGVGGTLWRRRLSWFSGFDQDLRNDPAVSIVKHPDRFFAQPSNDELQLLSARLRLSNADPIGEGLSAYSSMLSSLAELLGPGARSSVQSAAFTRMDSNLAERHHLTVEANGAMSSSPGGGLTRVAEAYGNHSLGNAQAREGWLLARWEAYLTPNLLAITQSSLGKQVLRRPAETPSAFEAALNASGPGPLPQMIVDSRYGFTIGNPARFGSGAYPDEHRFELQETLSWAHGPFLIKSGVSVRHSADQTSFLPNRSGTYHYARVENFISDAVVFRKYGLLGAPGDQHNCDPRGKAWRDSTGQLNGLGYLPCYSYFTQTLGPTNWRLSTNDWASFTTAQWQPSRDLVLSGALRWAMEELPPPILAMSNPDLPLTQKLPALGSEWAPRFGLAWGRRESSRPVLEIGYGVYFGRTSSSLLESALTQTGSPHGDQRFLFRPTDNLSPLEGGAPPFPYVLSGLPGSVEKPNVVEFVARYRNPEIHQADAELQQSLPGHVVISVSASMSLGRRLPITVDTNLDPSLNPGSITYGVVDASGKGPIRSKQITIPFFAAWPSMQGSGGRMHPSYQQIEQIAARANSTYQAGTIRLTRNAPRGLSFHLRYTYGHAADWNPNESSLVTGSSVLDPTDFSLEYGPGNLDIRHSASAVGIWNTPWKHRHLEGWLSNNWTLSSVGWFHSGLPFTMRTAGRLSHEFTAPGSLVAALAPGMNGSGGDNRVYGVGRNIYRYPQTWKLDLRLRKQLTLGHERDLELFAESYNLFNHQNVTELETVGYFIEPGGENLGLPTLNYLTGIKAGQTEFGQPLNINGTEFFRPRQLQFGVRLRY